MIISDLNDLLSFFGNNRRAATTAQSTISKLYAFVCAWKGNLERPDDQVITLDKIFDECSRSRGVDVAYGFATAPEANSYRLYIIRNGVVGVIEIGIAKEVAEITATIEEIPY